jgi:uncharacterized protein YjiS (DUF1127 family)
MDGLVILRGSRQRRPAGYALVEILIELGISAVTAVRRGLTALWRAYEMARVRREMHALSDHYLRDIGISRNEIDYTFR